MKKFVMMMAAAVMVAISAVGCNWYKENKANIHEYTVDATFKMMDKAINKKLTTLKDEGKITEEEYKIFVKRTTEDQEKLRQLINEIYAKYKAEQEKKLEKADVTVGTVEATTTAEVKTPTAEAKK